MNYLIELKQLVKYPRCRIYRRFLTTLMKSKDIRTCGTSYLFFYMILCAFASYTHSRRVVGRAVYELEAGEGVCSFQEMVGWFRFRERRRALAILQTLQEHRLVNFLISAEGTHIKYIINEWEQMNKIVHTSYEAHVVKTGASSFCP